MCSAVIPARPRPEPRSRSYLLLPPSFTISLHPVPPPCTLRRPASPPPRAGRAIFSSYPLPSCSAFPFFFIKLPKRKSGREG